MLYSNHSDIVAVHLGTKTVLYRSWSERGEIPFWRADLFSGYTALTNPQNLYTYPLHFLFYLMPPEAAVGGTFWLHFVVAALGFYLLGGVLGLGRWARLLMAAAALFNFKLMMVTYAGWLPHVPGITIFPLLFAAIFYLAKRPGLRGSLAVAGAGAICLLAGHLQFFYYSIWFAAAYLAGRIVEWWRAGQRQTVRKVGISLLYGIMLAAGLTAYLYLPLVAEIPWISRGKASYDFFLGNHAVAPRHLLTFLYPEAAGSPLDGSYASVELWEDVAYFGIIPLLLAIVGAVWGWRRHPTRFLVVSFIVSLLLTMNTPVLRLFYNVLPGFYLFRCPSRFLFLTVFFGITLAGIGFDETITRLREKHRSPLLAPLLAGSLLLVITLEGIFYARRYLTTVPHEQVIPHTDYERFLAADVTLFRIAPFFRYSINHGWAAPMGLQLITGFDSFNFRHYQEYFDILQMGSFPAGGARVWADLNNVARWDLLDALNVKYIVSNRPLVLPRERFQQVAHWSDQPFFVLYHGVARGPLYLYQNNHFLQRAFWVKEVVGVGNERRTITQMNREQLDHTAIIHDPLQRRFQCIASPEDRVEVLEASDGYLSLQTRNRARRFLVISEVWHPGWRAFLDGKELRLCRTDLALMGAWIPPGTHRLVLRFRPLYWSLSLGVSALSGCIFFFLLVIQYRQHSQAGETD